MNFPMMPGKPFSIKMRTLIEKEKKVVRKRIIERGIMHFRADEEFMAALLEAAEHMKKHPVRLPPVPNHRASGHRQTPQLLLPNQETG